MPLTEEHLVGYLRIQFRKSSRLRIWQFSIQIAIAVPAALSVVITSSFGSYALAIAGVILLGVWWLVTNSYTEWRNGAHAARRAALIAGGVAKPFTPSAILNLTGKMKVTQHDAVAAQKHDYYASEYAVGPERLAEIVEESAFYSAPLQRASAKAMLLTIVILIVVAGITVLFTLPFVEHGNCSRPLGWYGVADGGSGRIFGSTTALGCESRVV